MRTTSANSTRSLAQNFPLCRGNGSSQLLRKRNSATACELPEVQARSTAVGQPRRVQPWSKRCLPRPRTRRTSSPTPLVSNVRARTRGDGVVDGGGGVMQCPTITGRGPGSAHCCGRLGAPRIHILAPQAALANLPNLPGLSTFTSNRPSGSSAGTLSPDLSPGASLRRVVSRFLLPLVMDSPMLLSYSTGNGGIRGNRHKFWWAYSPREAPPTCKTVVREVEK